MEKLPVVNIINQHTRRFFRDIGGFILPLIASGVKIQIFIRSRDLLCCFGNIPFQIDSVKKKNYFRDARQDVSGGVGVQRHPRDGGPALGQQLRREEGERHGRLPGQVGERSPRPNYRMVLIADQRGWSLCTIMDPDLSKTVIAQTGLML